MSKEAMKRFLIETSVENAEGSQTWYVDATSEAEALEQYEQGGCDLYASNVDVTSLGEPEISGETTLDDFGDFAEQPAPKVVDCHAGGICVQSGLRAEQPAQRKSLTGEEIWKFWWSRPEVPDGEDDSMEAEFVAAVRRVLAARGIKE